MNKALKTIITVIIILLSILLYGWLESQQIINTGSKKITVFNSFFILIVWIIIAFIWQIKKPDTPLIETKQSFKKLNVFIAKRYLSEGYFRLYLIGLFIIPLVLTFLIINNDNDYLLAYLFLFLTYLIITHLIIWVYKGFLKDRKNHN